MSSNDVQFEQVQQSWREREAAYEQLCAELLPANKAVLLAALAAAGITHVTVGFEGSGDEGQIDSVIAKAGSQSADIPGIVVELSRPNSQSSAREAVQPLLADAITDFANELVCRTYPHWEDGDGAYGEVVFDVDGDMITLEHNARYISTEHFEHQF